MQAEKKQIEVGENEDPKYLELALANLCYNMGPDDHQADVVAKFGTEEMVVPPSHHHGIPSVKQHHVPQPRPNSFSNGVYQSAHYYYSGEEEEY